MTTMAEVKSELRAAGYLVDDDPWPTGAFHILTVGSKKTDLDTDKLSSKMSSMMGISNIPLPRNPNFPNLYYFLAYRSAAPTSIYDDTTGTWINAPFLVGEIEDYLDDVYLAMVNPYPVAETPDNAVALAAAAEDWMKSSEDEVTPILFGSQQALDANTWYFLRVLSNTGFTVRSGEVKMILESLGASVLAPDEGVLGIFFPSEKVASKGSTRVLYRPDDGPRTTAEVQQMLQKTLPGVTVGGFTTDRLTSNQAFIDTMYGAYRATNAAGDGLGDLTRMIEQLLKIIPTVMWLGVGMLGLYGLAKVYGAWKGKRA